jgi:hypothetical protein
MASGALRLALLLIALGLRAKRFCLRSILERHAHGFPALVVNDEAAGFRNDLERLIFFHVIFLSTTTSSVCVCLHQREHEGATKQEN